MVDNRFFFNHKTDGYMPVRKSKKYFSFLSDKSFLNLSKTIISCRYFWTLNYVKSKRNLVRYFIPFHYEQQNQNNFLIL